MKFCDLITIQVTSGSGGNGCASFRREKFVEFGGPDGGHGGKGGDIIIRGNDQLPSLSQYRYNRLFTAENGGKGESNKKKGRDGKNLVLNVPLGTEIYDEQDNLLLDITENKKFRLLQGGQGGIGNVAFKNSVNRAPKNFTFGQKGETAKITLKLKSIADIGLIGLPNVGKSTLLSLLSNAKPEIADYPFTTLSPNLGIIQNDYQKLIVADIPGLVKDAHKGIGLGLRFLGHIERCSTLVYVLSSEDNLLVNLALLKEEIKAYKPSLINKKFHIVITKGDLITSESQEQINNFYTKFKNVSVISSFNQDSVTQLKIKILNTHDT